jgi:uroporphyrinogen decarboxylase
MKPRERVLKAFRKMNGLPDRVPIQFELCRQLNDHFSKKLNIPVHYTNNMYEDVTYRISCNEIRLALGADVVVTGAAEANDYKKVVEPDKTWLNEYKMRMRQGPVYVDLVEYPLANVQSASDLASFSLPDPHAKGRFRDAKDLVAKYKDEYFIIGDIEVTIFTLVQQLVGMEKFLTDLMMEAEYLQPLLTKCTDFQIEIGKGLIEAGVDAFWVGDDFGTQNGLLLPNEVFESQLEPHYRRLVSALKHYNPKVVPILHCDGAVRDLLPKISEIGFEVFNPVQPGVPGHSPLELKKAFGDKFTFWGAIDQQHLIPMGTDQELEKDIREKISILEHNGGYMISPAHTLQSDVSPERVEKFIELCMKHGRYK